MKRILICALCLILFLSSCAMENVIPEQEESNSVFFDNAALYESAVLELADISYDCLISRTEFYRPDEAGDYVGVYIQNMQDKSLVPYDGGAVKALLTGGVKMIDMIRRDDLVLISFSLCIPGKSFDYGYYYSSANRAVYLGDPSRDLTPEKTGFVYTQKTSLGSSVTYYTESLTDAFYYYEIS